MCRGVSGAVGEAGQQRERVGVGRLGRRRTDLRAGPVGDDGGEAAGHPLEPTERPAEQVPQLVLGRQPEGVVLVEGVQRREVDPVTAVAAVVDAVTGDRAP